MNSKRTGKMAFSYLRFSTTDQKKGDSTRRQIALSEAWCERNNAILDERLHDEGVSGWKGKNSELGALAAFLEAVRRGKVPRGSFLIIEHIDRLTRQKVRQALTLWLQILDAGITIVTLDPERTYTPDSANDALGLIEPILYFATNNEKSERLSSRLKKTWAQKRKKRKPLTSNCPAWVRLSDDRTKYEPIPHKVKVVKKMVAWALEGHGDIKILQKLNRAKIPPISDNETWSHSYVAKILRNAQLTGRYHPGTQEWEEIEIGGKKTEQKKHRLTGEVWDNYYPRVISDETFDRLRAIRLLKAHRKTRTRATVANLFSGMLFNARDGKAFERIVKKQPRLISTSFRNGLDGDSQSFAYAPFEVGVLNAMVKELRPSDLFGSTDTVEEQENKIETLGQKLLAVEANLAALEIEMDGDDAAAGMPRLVAKMKKWELEKAQLKQQIEEEKVLAVSSEEDVLNDLQALAKIVTETDVPNIEEVRGQLRSKLQMLVESIWVVIHGQKRSKFKVADVQIFFRAGGCKHCMIWAEENDLMRASFDRETWTSPGFDYRELTQCKQTAAVVEGFGNSIASVFNTIKEQRMRAKWAELNAARRKPR